MKVVHTIEQLQEVISEQKEKGKKVGFVPTLGALHNGHMSLISQAKRNCDFSVCSIFVNPTQFDDKEDLKKYPRTVEADQSLLEKHDCDLLFLPTVNQVYPNGDDLDVNYDLGELETILEGKTRPGHYQGVAQVVHILLELVKPDILFLGQKDYQQVKILSRMITKMSLPVEVFMCDIIREKDGLAMSSRNRRLNKEEREVAWLLNKTLRKCKENYREISLEKIQKWAETNLNSQDLISVDYISFRDATSLKEINSWDDAKEIIVLGAIFLGPIRLIDNMIIC